MAQTKERLLVAPEQVVVKAQAPRLRRKLQKSVTKQRSTAARRLGLGASNEVLDDNKCDTANRARGPPAQAQSCLPLPSPDLTDSKWSEFFRGTGCLHYQPSVSESQDCLANPVNIIPEFSHLAVRDAQHHRQQQQQQPRSSLSADSQTSSKSTTMRRRAKTPIFSIGQLETIPRPTNALRKTSSVELIAEQYRALLNSPASVYSDSHSEPPPTRQGGADAPDSFGLLRRQQSSDELQLETPFHAAATHPSTTPPQHNHPLQQPELSPTTSDDGTLVSFEEETVYFKPVSFSPEPRSPQQQPHYFVSPLSPATPPPENLSLQICLDLLTRDLSSALRGRPSRVGVESETSALQVWVMIEAYERLRDQLGEVSRELEGVMDLWLRALYSVHDGLVGGSSEEGMVEELD